MRLKIKTEKDRSVKLKFDHPSEWLKWIAFVAMVLDHIGLIFFSEQLWMRYLGRLSFPIFTYFVAIGYLRTSSVSLYVKRLIVFAFLSQLPYSLLFQTTMLNVFVTLLVGLWIVHLAHKKHYFLMIVPLLLSVLISMDYGLYGVVLPLLFYISQKDQFFGYFLHSVWLIIFINPVLFLSDWLTYYPTYQAFSLVGVLLALTFPNHITTRRFPRYFLYLFYPIHLIFLFVLVVLIYY